MKSAHLSQNQKYIKYTDMASKGYSSPLNIRLIFDFFLFEHAIRIQLQANSHAISIPLLPRKFGISSVCSSQVLVRFLVYSNLPKIM